MYSLDSLRYFISIVYKTFLTQIILSFSLFLLDFLFSKFSVCYKLKIVVGNLLMTTPYKFDWYQSGVQIVISILKRGLSVEDCRTLYNPATNSLDLMWNDELIFSTTLYRTVSKEKISIICTPSKVEVRLQKLVDERWPELSISNNKLDCTGSSKSSSWDRLAKEADKEEEESNGVDQLFKRIYQDADDDVKRAMIKSFSESNGTVLSTNWNEIKQKKTETKPPDDMEFKKYEM